METEKRLPGRPAGEVRQALLAAAAELATETSAPTMRELAHRACVGIHAARQTLCDMVRAGQLHVVRPRPVPYRNRPVAEYAPAKHQPSTGFDFKTLTSAW